MKRRLARGIGLALAVTLLLALLGEVAVRAVAGRQLDPLRALTPAGVRFYGAQMFVQGSGGAPRYRGRPGADVEVTGVRYRHDSLGLRDRELGEKVAGEFRVLLIGDSNVYGWGVPEPDLLARQLERELGGGVLGGRTARVVGAGFPGYNTEDQRALYHRLRDQVQPDLVLIAWFMNDCERFGLNLGADGTLFADPLPVPEAWKPILWRSYLYRSLSLVRTTALFQQGRNALDAAENLTFAEAELRRFAADLRAAGTAFAVLEIPELEPSPGADRIRPGAYRAERFSAWLQGVAERTPFPLVSLVSAVPDRPLSDLWVHPGSGDRHPNAAALAAYATAIRAFLTDSGLVPLRR